MQFEIKERLTLEPLSAMSPDILILGRNFLLIRHLRVTLRKDCHWTQAVRCAYSPEGGTKYIVRYFPLHLK